jgi:hypothetical protein
LIQGSRINYEAIIVYVDIGGCVYIQNRLLLSPTGFKYIFLTFSRLGSTHPHPISLSQPFIRVITL